jgi:hypothetical protein
MDIGKQQRIIQVEPEPITTPVEAPIEPLSEPVSLPEREEVPAGA